jgi:hypothetical protein
MSKQLDLPFNAIIPYHVQADENISDAAKIYFGQITGLAVRCGYIWATDEQLSEMKKVSIRNIQRWNKELEDGGFIVRETQNYPVKQEDGAFQWIKKRKIFVTPAFSREKKVGNSPPEDEEWEREIFSGGDPGDSKNVCGTAKNGGSIEPAKNGGSIEPAKNGGIINTSSNYAFLQQQENPPSPPVVVVPIISDEEEKRDLLAKYELEEKVIAQLISYELAHLTHACEAFDQYANKKELVNPTGALIKSVKEGWKPNKIKEEIEKSQEKILIQQNKEYAEKCKSTFKFNENYGFSIDDYCVMLERPKATQPLEYKDENFKELLKKFIISYKI